MRGTGRTKAMVEELPASGSYVVVHTTALRTYVRDMILELRGSEVLGATKIEVVSDRRGADRLRGVRKPIFVDHAFFNGHVVADVVEMVRILAAAANMTPKKAG